MSYVQEARVPATHGSPTHASHTQSHAPAHGSPDRTARSAADRHVRALPARIALALLFTLGLLHGALYAAFLPPWGLIDEAQHLHYIQYIAEQQALPIAGELYLSDEIIASLFATQRWETFHWTPPPAPDPAVMGLEGYSYEAYQPPLYYLLMTPFYWALPDDMLIKVFGLRAVMVLLSLVTVWAIYRSAQLILPRMPHVPFLAGLLLVAIPERAMATSRINNDGLLEVIAALFFLVLTHALVAGLTTRRSLLLVLLLGLGAWVKIPAGLLGVPLLLLLWVHRRDPAWWRYVGYVVVVVAPLGIALAIRNLWLYGDLTGFAAFDQLHRLAPVDSSFDGFVRALVSLPNHLWLIWWKGSEVGQNGLLTLFYWIMVCVVGLAWARLALDFWRTQQTLHGGEKPLGPVPNVAPAAVCIYGVTVLLYAVAVMGSYYQGMVPVIQGRFLLPAIVPFILLLVWGWSRFAWGDWFTLSVVVLLWGMGLLSLFGNLIPYYYYWSGVLQGAVLRPEALGISEWITLVYQRALLDKPPFMAPLLLLLPVLYCMMLILTLVVTLRAVMRSRQVSAGDPLPVHS